MKHRLCVFGNAFRMATFKNGSTLEERVVNGPLVKPAVPSGKNTWENCNELLLARKFVTIPESYDFMAK